MQILELDESYKEKLESALVDLEISGAVRRLIFEEKEAIAISKYYSMEDFISKQTMHRKQNQNKSYIQTQNNIY